MIPQCHLEQLFENASTIDEATEVLLLLLNGGYGVWTDGNLYNVRHLVAKINDMKIEVYSNDHMPPHFHMRSAGINASFKIEDCKLIVGMVSASQMKLIRYWHARFKSQLMVAWERSRPGDPYL